MKFGFPGELLEPVCVRSDEIAGMERSAHGFIGVVQKGLTQGGTQEDASWDKQIVEARLQC